MKITIEKLEHGIFQVSTDEGVWSDGSPLNERMAFCPTGLSSVAAQAKDGERGVHYMIITPASFKSTHRVYAAATTLESIGDVGDKLVC